MKRFASLAFSFLLFAALSVVCLRAEILRDIQFTGQSLEEVGIKAKNLGDHEGVIAKLPATRVEGEKCAPYFLFNRNARSWTALVLDLPDLGLPGGTRVRLTTWVKTNLPGFVRVALSDGVSYGGDCRLLTRGQGKFTYARQALSVECTLTEGSRLLSAAVGLDYESAGVWAAVDRILVETVPADAPVAPLAELAADMEGLPLPSAFKDCLGFDIERQLASARLELRALQEAGLGGEAVNTRRELARQLRLVQEGKQTQLDLLAMVRDFYGDSLQVQLVPEMTAITQNGAITPESTKEWTARTLQGGHDGALLVVSNRAYHPQTYELTLSGEISKAVRLHRLMWVDGRPDCVIDVTLDSLQEIPADSIQCFLLEFVAKDDLAPGTYSGELTATPLDGLFAVRKSALQFTVLPGQMPRQMPVRTFLFDYGQAPREDIAPLMKEGRLNTIQFNLSGRDLTRIGALTRQIEAAGMREGCFAYIEEWFTREEGWHEQDDAWLDQLVAEMEANGWRYDEWCLHIFDEVFGDLFLECAKKIKAHNPNVRIFSDMLETDVEVLKRFNPYLDYYCPHIRTQFQPPRADYQAAIDYIYSSGKPVWLYDCDSRPIYPHDHARAISWLAWLDGAKGITYWALITSKFRNPVGDYNHGMVYSLENRMVPSRRLLMYFAGLEDYLLLEKAAAIAPERTREIAQKVVDGFTLYANTMCQAHSQARQELLDIIATGK